MRNDIQSNAIGNDLAQTERATVDKSKLLGFRTLTVLAPEPSRTKENLGLLHNKIGEPPPPPAPGAAPGLSKREDGSNI